MLNYIDLLCSGVVWPCCCVAFPFSLPSKNALVNDGKFATLVNLVSQWIICGSGIVNQTRDWSCRHLITIIRNQHGYKSTFIIQRRVEPSVTCLRCQNSWHAVVNSGEEFVRLGGNNGAGTYLLPIRAAPA